MSEQDYALRVLDANFNRAREGLRVCEEYARFGVENPAWAETLKNIRHALKSAEEMLVHSAGRALASARDTAGDCGTEIKTAAENARTDLRAVLAANLKRAEEALRVLAEYGKIFSVPAAEILEKARYALYDLEPLFSARRDWRARLRSARLCVLVTTDFCSADPLTACREVVAAGADMVQLREKNMEDGAFLRLAEKMLAICGDKALLEINDRAHIAKLLNTPALHIGQGDLPLHMARRLVGHDTVIGVSASTPEEADTAVAGHVDCLGIGPVFPTQTKEIPGTTGLDFVRWAVAHSPVPYHAIGGINQETAGRVLETGCFGLAVCSAIVGAKDIAAAAGWFREQIDRYPVIPFVTAEDEKSGEK